MAFDKYAPVSASNPLPVTFGANTAVPLTLCAKNVSVRTSGSPADIATIALPSAITRWAPATNVMVAVNESAADLSDAGIVARTAAGGSGAAVSLAAFLSAGPANQQVRVDADDFNSAYTAASIVIRQTVDSTHAGTVSFYVSILPLP